MALDEGDVVVVRARGRMDGQGDDPRLDPGVYPTAPAPPRPGLDPYALEADWLRHWRASGRPRLHDAEAAFVAFARSRAARMPQP